MRLQYIFYGRNKQPHPVRVKSMPPVQQSIALEIYLESVKTQLAKIPHSRTDSTENHSPMVNTTQTKVSHSRQTESRQART